jgi:hypothetical protein
VRLTLSWSLALGAVFGASTTSASGLGLARRPPGRPIAATKVESDRVRPAGRLSGMPLTPRMCAVHPAAPAMVRPRLALLACLALGACASAPAPTAWTRADGRAVDPNQLEADKAICRDEVDQAARVTAARRLTPITLPGQDSPAVKLSIDCMARRGYSAVR